MGPELLGNGDSIEYAICWRKQKAYLLVLIRSCLVAVLQPPDHQEGGAPAAILVNRDDYRHEGPGTPQKPFVITTQNSFVCHHAVAGC